MEILGLPLPMFLVFVGTVLAGSLGAIHYVIVHVIMGKPFAEIPPPLVRQEAARGPAGSSERAADGSHGDTPDDPHTPTGGGSARG